MACWPRESEYVQGRQDSTRIDGILPPLILGPLRQRGWLGATSEEVSSWMRHRVCDGVVQSGGFDGSTVMWGCRLAVVALVGYTGRGG